MNLFINIVFLTLVTGFAGLYLVNLILNLVRAIRVNRELKKHPLFVDAKVINVIHSKKRVFVKVKYSSPTNFVLLSDIFEFAETEFFDQYFVDQDVKIIYPDLKNHKRITCFPTYIAHPEDVNPPVLEAKLVTEDDTADTKEDKKEEKIDSKPKKNKEQLIVIDGKNYYSQKLTIEAGPVVTDAMLFAAGVYIFIVTLINLITPSATTAHTGLSYPNTRPLYISKNGTTNVNDGCLEVLFIVAIIVIYIMLFSYIIERLTVASPEHNQNYLKLCGIKGTAQVKTYKFGRNKDSKGNKEAQLKIEFFSNKGEKVEADINSYMYTQTQEEYIQILYDPMNPKNVVYMRQ